MTDPLRLEPGPEMDAAVAERVMGWTPPSDLFQKGCWVDVWTPEEPPARGNRFLGMWNGQQMISSEEFRAFIKWTEPGDGELDARRCDAPRSFSRNAGAAWEVHEHCSAWPYSQRQRYLHALQDAVSADMVADGALTPDSRVAWPDVMAYLKPIHFCRAALKVAGEGHE